MILIHTIVIMNNNRKKSSWSQLLMFIMYTHARNLLITHFHCNGPVSGNRGLFKMIVWVLTICHTQHTWDRSICIFLFNRTILQVFVTYLTGALYVHPLWFYKHQHDNRVRSKLFVACQRWWFQWQFCLYLQFRDTCGKRRNINLMLDVTP